MFMDSATSGVEHQDYHSGGPVENSLFKSKYFIASVIATVISIFYWSVFSLNAYNTYHEYSDLGLFAFDMYYHINFASAVHGLQYFVFANHIAIDQLLILPIFAVFTSALSLLIIQTLVVSATGLVIFLVSRDIIKNEKISLLLCLAFLINPGTFGILIFDYHAEMMIPLLFILTFYFYFKKRIYPFVGSLLLLLGTMEIAPFIALAFAVTMAIYAIVRENDATTRRLWLKYSLIAIVVSVAVLIIYGYIINSLSNAYVAGQYPDLPSSLQVLNTVSGQFASVGAGLKLHPMPSGYMPMLAYVAFALLIVFVSFGLGGLFDPIFAVLFVSPWIFELFVIGNSAFIFPWYQYFGFSLGGSAVIAILSLKNIDRKASENNFRFSFLEYGHKVGKYIIISIPIFMVALLLLWPYFVYSINVYNFQQAFLFYTNQSARSQIQQLNSMIALLPENASVMAPFFTMPHLFNRKYLELIPSGPEGYNILRLGSNSSTYMGDKYGFAQLMWFYPQYILSDFNPQISESAVSGYQVQNYQNMTDASIENGSAVFNGNYLIYNYSGLAILLKSESS